MGNCVVKGRGFGGRRPPRKFACFSSFVPKNRVFFLGFSNTFSVHERSETVAKKAKVVVWLCGTKKSDPSGNRTHNLRVWNPTRYHCAMESCQQQNKKCPNRGSNSGPRACEARVITNYTIRTYLTKKHHQKTVRTEDRTRDLARVRRA
jgi:hypothetical protein